MALTNIHFIMMGSLKKTFWSSIFLVLMASLGAFAQAPTALSYPPGTVSYQANIDNVFLAPTVSGIVDYYDVNPALPFGMSFDTNTGVISGMPDNASALTAYTITAHNSQGSTSTVLNMVVFNTFYQNSNGQVKFIADNREFKVGNGTHVGDIALNKDVVNIGGQSIDCIVTTVSVNNVSGWTTYDQNASSGSSFSNNDPAFFSPQLTFGSGGGSVHFHFEYILGGSYDAQTKTGVPVTVQNVYLNTYDIDGNGSANSNQYNQFSGFSFYDLSSSNSNIDVSYNDDLQLTQFKSKTTQNTTNVLAPENRVRVHYDLMSSFDIVIGGLGLSYYFLDFSIGGGFTVNTTSVPSVDLNTELSGNGNSGEACGEDLNFTAPNQNNVETNNGSINSVSVSFSTSDIKDGADEVLNVASVGDFALNFSNNQNFSNFSLGGVNYKVTASVSGGKSVLTFARTSGTLSQEQTESLLDSLSYANNSVLPTNGPRKFIVNLYNTTLKSPDALFTANVNCTSISGHIYHDANALTDNTVNSNSTTGQFSANDMYAVLVDGTTGEVISKVGISAGGAYTFGRVVSGLYKIYIVPSDSQSLVNVGAQWDHSILPPNGDYVFTGENLGSDAGNDLQIDGMLTVQMGTTPVSDANFGLEQKPSTADKTIDDIDNPQGFNLYTIPNGSFVTNDPDGTVDSIVIYNFPDGANYLKVGDLVYTNPTGGVCPPQFTCSPWPGSLTVGMSGGNPIESISVDPTLDDVTSVSVPFYAYDNGHISSRDSATLLINFKGLSTTYTVSGNVWNDANANGNQDANEDGVNPAKSGENLYAVLIQTSNTYSGAPTILYTSVVDNSGNYSFEEVPEGFDFEVRIYSSDTVPTDGVAASTLTPNMADGWIGVSTNNNGVIQDHQNTNDLVNVINNLSGDVANVNFGLNEIPTAGSGLNGGGGNPGGTALVEVPASTFTNVDSSKDILPGRIDSIIITGIPDNADAIEINGTKYCSIGSGCTPFPTEGVSVPTDSFGNPTQIIQVDPSFENDGQVTIHFIAVDNGGIHSANSGTAVLDFSLINISGNVFDDENGLTGGIDGVGTNVGGLNAVLVDASDNVVAVVAVNSDGTYNFENLGTGTYHVLLTTDQPAVNTPSPTTSSLPEGWVHVGESLNNVVDASADGSLSLGAVNNDVADANFGIHHLPIALDDSTVNNTPTQPAVINNLVNNDTDYYGAGNQPDPNTISLIANGGSCDSSVNNNCKKVIVSGEGTWIVDADGKLTFTPDSGFYVDPTPIDYSIEDEGGYKDTAKIIVKYSPAADLAITKTNGTTEFTPGNTTTYTVVVTNNGPSAVTDAQVTDVAPTNTTITGWTATFSNASGDNSNGSGDLNEQVDIAVGGSVTYSINLAINEDYVGDSLINTATVIVPNDVTDPNPDNNIASDTDHGLFIISGNVFNDANGLTNDSVDGNGTNANTALNAILTDENNNVVAVTTVQNDGTYEFEGQPKGEYSVLITTNSGQPGSSAPAVALPENWVSTGEHVGEDQGNDGQVDGILSIGELNQNISAVNFGIEQLPTALGGEAASQVNPGGTNNIIVDQSLLEGSDPDGSVVSNHYMDFPTNVTSVTIGGVTYTSSNWLMGGVTVPTGTEVTFDPVDGAVTVEINYSVVDNAGFEGSVATAKIPLTTFGISGNVYDDNDGLMNGINGSGTNIGDLNAVLVDANGQVISVESVETDGTYSFDGLSGGAYSIVVTTNTPTVGSSNPAGELPSGWVYVGTQLGTATPNSNTDGTLGLGAINNDVADANFGIHHLPIALDDSTVNNTPTQPAVINDLVNNDTDYYGIGNQPDPTTISLITNGGSCDSAVNNNCKKVIVSGEGTWEVDADGKLTFTPDSGFYVDPTPIDYSIEDEGGYKDTAKIIVKYSPAADLAITKTDGSQTYTPGDTITYTITVTNNGPADVSDAKVTDNAPTGTTIASWSSTYNGGISGTGNLDEEIDIAKNETVTFTVKLATPSNYLADQLTNVATVTAPAGVTDPVDNNNEASDTDDIKLVSDLAITKTDASATFTPGTTTTYTIEVSNNGPSDVLGATVLDNAPAGVTFKSVSLVSATPGSGVVSFNNDPNSLNQLVNITSGGLLIYSVEVEIPADYTSSTLINTASVTNPTGVTDPNLNNNEASDTDDINLVSDLAITKTNGTTEFTPGTTTTYTVVVTNNGPSAVTNAQVTDVAPTNTTITGWTATFSNASGDNSNGSGDLNEQVDIAVGGSVTYSIDLAINEDYVGDSLINTATVIVPNDVTDPNPDNNIASDTDHGLFIISGNVFNDANGLTNDSVDGNGTNANTALNAILTDENNNVVAVTTVQNDGTYEFEGQPKGEYSVLITTNAGQPGNPAPAVALPENWVSTGEHVGEDQGNDGQVDGILSIGELNQNISAVNFGIEQLPTALGGEAVSQVNPGGTNNITVDQSLLNGSDPDGSVVSNHYTDFPTNVTSVTIDGTTYTSSNWPTGGVTVATGTEVTFDPVDGAVTVEINYSVVDNAGFEGSVATAKIPLTTFGISGNVYDDNDGLMNGINGSGTNVGGLNAVLVDANGQVISVEPVETDGTYSFDGLSGGTYSIVVTTNTPTVGSSNPAGELPSGWVYVGTQLGTATPNSNTDGILDLGAINNEVADANFGIHHLPIALDDSTVNNTPTQPAVINDLVNNDTDYYGTGNQPDPTTISLITNGGSCDSSVNNNCKKVIVSGEGTWEVDADGKLTFTPDSGFYVDPTPIDYSIEDEGGYKDTAKIIVKYSPAADLAITKTDGSQTYTPGDTITYTIVVTNNGPADVSDAKVTDNAPTGTTIASWSSTYNGGISGTGNLEENIDLAKDETVTFTVKLATPSNYLADQLTNVATVTAPAGVTDPIDNNNEASDTDDIDLVSDLAITKTDASATFTPGTTTTYTIEVSNYGPSDVTGAHVTDLAPANTTITNWSAVFTNADGAASGTNDLDETIDIKSGGNVVYTLTLSIPSNYTASTLENVAEVAVPTGVTDSDPTNNQASDTDDIKLVSDLAITKTDDSATFTPGTTTTYTIEVSNNGPSDVAGAHVTDFAPANTTITNWSAVFTNADGAASGTSDLDETIDIKSGGNVVYTLTLSIPSNYTASTLENVAKVAVPAEVTDPDTTNNKATDVDDINLVSDLAITKTDDSATFTPGTTTTYTIEVSNNGPSDVAGAHVTDFAPANTTITGWSAVFTDAGGATSGNGNLDQMINIDFGGKAVYTLTLSIPSDYAASTLENVANVEAPATVTDTNLLNNSDSDIDVVDKIADLRISKTDNSTVFTPGTDITYQITVNNDGPSAVTGAGIKDVAPANTTITGWTATFTDASGNTTSTGSGDLDETVNINAGGQVTYSLNLSVSEDYVGDSLINLAQIIVPSDITDPDLSNNMASDTDQGMFIISGNVLHDANGLTNDSVDGVGTTFAGLNALLLDASGNVVASTTVLPDGSYSFASQPTGEYAVLVTTNNGQTGNAAPAVALPENWVSTGENVGRTSGNDGQVDGILPLGNIHGNVREANFGIEQLPFALGGTENTQINPGNNATVSVETTLLTGSDLDGTVDSVHFVNFPSNADALVINGTSYTTANWPSNGVFASINNLNVEVDPIDGAVTTSIPYTVIDNAGFESDSVAHAILPFHTLSISGKVMDDANGLKNQLVDGQGTNAGGLNAVLVNTITNEVAATTPIANDGNFSFNDQDGGNYSIIITTESVTVGQTAPVSSTLPNGWISVGEHLGTGLGSDGTPNGVYNLGKVGADVSPVNFGLDQIPTADAKSFNLTGDEFSNQPTSGYPTVQGYKSIAMNSPELTGYPTGGSLSGSDPEDCPTNSSCSAGASFRITTVNANTKLYYNYGGAIGIAPLNSGAQIANFDPTRLEIYGLEGSGVNGEEFGFTYTMTDVAGVNSEPVLYKIAIENPLNVKLISFDAIKEGKRSNLTWTTASEVNNSGFEIQRSNDGQAWKAIGFVNSLGENGNSQTTLNYQSFDEQPLNGANYYRLKQVDFDGHAEYSEVRVLKFDFDNHISVYPNPTKNFITIQGLNGGEDIMIVDALGRTLKMTQATGESFQISLAGFAAGRYEILVKVSDTQVKSFSIIKEN